MDKSKKVVRIFPDIASANAAVSLLNADNIETVIVSNDSEGELPPLQTPKGAALLVKSVDEFRARRILAVALPGSDKDTQPDWGMGSEGLLETSRRRAPVIAGLLFVVLFVIPLIVAVVIALGGF